MAPGLGDLTGFTRNLGVDLTNDHPISFTYDSNLALADGELRDPSLETHIATRSTGVKPAIPLEDGRVECMSCHDPHVRDSDPTKSIKFLRLNRFQQGAPGGGSFDEIDDIICIGCHDKMGQAWSNSAHADIGAADETYKTDPATLREFPQGIKVWEAACLNCHDTHTVQGSRRLLREGTDALGSHTSGRSGGSSSIEETCYQCHTSGSESILTNVTEVPDIKTDFLLPKHMPIDNTDQQLGSEVHDIVDANFLEDILLLGRGELLNRHVECTGCHNPHRLQKNSLFNGNGSTVAGTHDHWAAEHSNIASGVLSGAWGVEPVYTSDNFYDMPADPVDTLDTGGFDVKKGVAGAGTGASNDYVTREYQICLKCHSNFGYADNNVYPTGNRPNPGDSGGGTVGAMGLDQYTNQAREFQAPSTHRGENNGTAPNPSPTGFGPASFFESNNHRSWHPVIGDTGRDAAQRNMSATATNSFLPPWDGSSIGSQTMYCSDCHGSNTPTGTVDPDGQAAENGSPWGPHGSGNDFILKGTWSTSTGSDTSGICFRCHDRATYATTGGGRSGFSGSGENNLHSFHAGQVGTLRCTWCHVAIPHGWKNKAFLVNLNDVGPEAGLSPGTEVSITGNNSFYNVGPYYQNAKLKIRSFARSGNWSPSNCGSRSGQGSVADTWMTNVCENP